MTWEETCVDRQHTLQYQLDRNMHEPQYEARHTHHMHEEAELKYP